MGSDLPSAEARAQRRLGLGVVIRDGDVLAWSRTVVQVLGPLAGAQAGIAGPVRTRGAGTAVAATLAFGVGARRLLSAPADRSRSPTWCSPMGRCTRVS
ncbi:MAG: hypothetical protein ABSA03_04730 [Streptosporangiaceae bacterium]